MTNPPSPSVSDDANSQLLSWTSALSVAGLLLMCCGSAFRSDVIFGFRDAGLFYFPLFQLVRDEWLAGRVPLWNPWTNAGQPLAAAATSSVFYPGQLLFLLPLPFSWTFNAYLWLHLLGAAWGSWKLSREQGRSAAAAGLAMLAYTFGGAVLFQTCNVVFLCGAAWLPWGLRYGLRCLDTPTKSSVLLLSAVLAMLVLCGDPQTGYHLGLMLGFCGLLRLAGEWRQGRSWLALAPAQLQCWGSLVAAAIVAAALSMIQISPTAEFSRLSDRDADIAPMSLWDVPGFLRRQDQLMPRRDTGKPPQWHDAILGRPVPPAKQYWQVYGFSLEPYRAIEFIWPQFYGRGFPEVDRWTDRAGITRSTFWNLSLYCGWLPCLLACAAARWTTGDWRVRCWTWLAMLSFIASWGEFGPVGLVRLANEAITQDSPDFQRHLGDEVGGLYWLLVTCLPGYDSFRFPAKWVGVTTLALAQLSAVGYDGLCEALTRKRASRFASVFLGLLSVGFLVATGLGIARGWYPGSANENAESLSSIWLPIAFSVVQGLILAVLALWWLRRSHDHLLPGSHGLGLAVLVVTAADLALAQPSLVFFMPVADIRAGSQLVKVVLKDREQTTHAQVSPQVRVYRLWEWGPESRDYRLWARHQSETLAQNVAFLHDAAMINRHGTMDLNDFTVFFDVLPVPDRQELICPRQSYDLWATEYFVLPSRHRSHEPEATYIGLERRWTDGDFGAEAILPIPTGEPLPEFQQTALAGGDLAEPIRVLRNIDALPRARIVHEAAVMTPIAPTDRQEWLRVMEALAFPGGLPLKTAAVIEDEELLKQHGAHLGGPADAVVSEEFCKIIRDEPQLVQIEAKLEQPGLVLLADVYYPGWTLTVATNEGAEIPSRILRVNRLQRGCWLPAGKHRLTYRYQPQSFFWGATVSAAAFIVWIAAWWMPIGARRSPGMAIPGLPAAPQR